MPGAWLWSPLGAPTPGTPHHAAGHSCSLGPRARRGRSPGEGHLQSESGKASRAARSGVRSPRQAAGPTLTCPFPRGREGSAGPGTKPGAFASFSTHSPELGPVLSLNLLSWSCQESSAGGVGASAFLL